MPHGIITGLPAVELFRDRWVCAVAEDNPEVGESITLGQLATLPWAAYGRPSAASVTRQLSMLGIEPNVQVSVDSFYLLPSLVARHPVHTHDAGHVWLRELAGEVGARIGAPAAP